jgi:hypothetical protein
MTEILVCRSMLLFVARICRLLQLTRLGYLGEIHIQISLKNEDFKEKLVALKLKNSTISKGIQKLESLVRKIIISFFF